LLVVERDAEVRREIALLLASVAEVDGVADEGEAAAVLASGARYDWVMGAPDRAVSRVSSGGASEFDEESPVLVSASIRDAVDRIRRVAAGPSTVLLTGETGTGKDVLAGLLHRLSPRGDRPFVKVSCAALPEALLESELFGHERGAFTGADRTRIGRFEQASEGTIFLDEIGELSPATQVKLLRVLDEREFHRLGGVETLRTGARIVAATHRDLARDVADGRFREDLYFRLAVITVPLAPLRERPEDIEPLALHFLERTQRESGIQGKRFSEPALERIRRECWRGNVRELRNAVERGVLMSDGDVIELGDLPDAGPGTSTGSAGSVDLPVEGVSLEQVERDLVLRALDQADFVQKEAAQLLRVSRRKLNYMIQRMGVTHPSWRRNRGPAPGVGASAASPAAEPPHEPGTQRDV
jgi:DNA-binding NtrC family response regulator